MKNIILMMVAFFALTLGVKAFAEDERDEKPTEEPPKQEESKSNFLKIDDALFNAFFADDDKDKEEPVPPPTKPDEPKYNVALGSAYLSELVDKYDGYFPMAIAAYNAGPSRVGTWIGLFGDPRRGDMDAIDWVEHIPIYETRNYVQRVMESYFLYRIKLGQNPKTILDFH